MIRNTDENKKRLLTALERHLGIVSYACEEVKISRKTFYQYCKEDIDFKETVDEINEISIDLAESQLLKKIKEGSEKSIHFYLRYRARKRGYSDSVDISINLEQPLFGPIIKKGDDIE